MTDREFIERLSEAKAKEAEAIETEIHQILKEGFTEETSFMFVRSVMAIRAVQPTSTVGGIYEMALQVGLREVIVKLLADRGGAKPKRKSGSNLR